MSFSGYGSSSKGYRLYDFTKKKVILSRDVIFNEQKFGHDDIGQETESHKYVYFDALMTFQIQIVTLWKKVQQIR